MKSLLKKQNIVQIFTFLCLLLGFSLFIYNGQEKIARQEISLGFDFLEEEAAFEISESIVEYSSFDTYGRALLVGLLNTLKVSVLGNILALLLGLFIGISLLSSNTLLRNICATYVDLMRNTPLLLQLFLWYALLSSLLPAPEEALSFMGIYFSNRGIVIPWIDWQSLSLSLPVFKSFNFEGGYTFSLEFSALLFGLVTYTSAFIAEIVRAGLLSVDRGQWEAASTLGLNWIQSVRYVILPQASRMAIPPLTSQVLNLTKNSSLAVAIAYPDFVSVANTTMNQTGQALELILFIMLVYLSFFSINGSIYELVQ